MVGEDLFVAAPRHECVPLCASLYAVMCESICAGFIFMDVPKKWRSGAVVW